MPSELSRRGRIHHVGLAVESAPPAIELYRALGLEVVQTEILEEQGIRATFLSGGAGQVELLEALRPDSPVGRFLARRGPGMHHICIETDDLEATLRDLETRGLELVDHAPRRGIQGRVAFLHPRAGFGVLIELIEVSGPADGERRPAPPAAGPERAA